jgi:hypothetical protein
MLRIYTFSLPKNQLFGPLWFEGQSLSELILSRNLDHSLGVESCAVEVSLIPFSGVSISFSVTEIHGDARSKEQVGQLRKI